jgi:F-type H+-transporting ATPase subunit b
VIFLIPEISGALLSAAAELPPGRVFGLDGQILRQILAQLISVGLLAFVLSKLLYKPVRDFMSKRTARVENQLKAAEREVAKANALKAEYEQKVKEIDASRMAILEEARKVAAEARSQVLDQAKKEAEKMRERASANIELELERARSEMRHQIIDVSALMAAKFMSKSMDKQTQDSLFEETMSELEGGAWLN